MRVVLFGATGMIGSGALIECLEDPAIEAVLVVGRRSCGVEHDKLTELVVDDMSDYSSVQDRFVGYDACFFCLGVSAAGMSEDQYRAITYGLTLTAAKALLAANPELVFCHISGAGAYSSEEGPMMWARVKGMTENAVLALGFRAAWIFRPAFVQPLKGVRSRTAVYNALYAVLGPLYPVLSRLVPAFVTTTAVVGRALIVAARDGAPKTILENRDMNELAG